jgi:hypothetical protein
MDCSGFAEEILECLEMRAEPVSPLREHLQECAACKQFSELQHKLESALEAEFSLPPLSPDFRGELRRQIRSQSRSQWREVLPDAMNVAGLLAVSAVAARYLRDISFLMSNISVSTPPAILGASVAITVLATCVISLAFLFRLSENAR